jgi:hypothetical protein
MLSPLEARSTEDGLAVEARPTMSLSRDTARVILGGLLVLLVAGSYTPSRQVKPLNNDQGDVALFETVVRRLRAGEAYYPAMGNELRQRGYPTASVFNWRTPFPLSAVAAFPKGTAICFFALGVLAIAGTLMLLMSEAPEAMLIALLAQIGVTISLLKVPQFALMAEAWAGFLIAASVVAYGRRWWSAGAALGVLALLARELTAPYCVACGVMALSRKRWRESAVWAIGAALYSAFLLLHVWLVSAQLGPAELAHKQSWVQFGGLPFLLRIVSFSGWYDVLPIWSRAVGLVLLVASVWATKAPRQLQVMVAAYLLFFSIVGQSFNQYWGLVTGPAFALATGYGVAGLWRLIGAARTKPTYAAP